MSYRRPYGVESSNPWAPNNSTYTTTYGSSFRNFSLGHKTDLSGGGGGLGGGSGLSGGRPPSLGLRAGRYTLDDKLSTPSFSPSIGSTNAFSSNPTTHNIWNSSSNSSSRQLPSTGDRFSSGPPPLAGSSSAAGAYMTFRDIFNQVSSITPHVFLCSVHAIDSARLRSLGVTLVVSAMADTPPSFPGVAETMHVPVEDVEYANLSIYFDRVADRIHAEEAKGRRTVVHCMAGISRSTSLVLAYLMKHHHMSLRQAFQHVRARRSCVQPNPGFWRQLVNYEERLQGSRSLRPVSNALSHSDSFNKSATLGAAGNNSKRPQFGLFLNRL